MNNAPIAGHKDTEYVPWILFSSGLLSRNLFRVRECRCDEISGRWTGLGERDASSSMDTSRQGLDEESRDERVPELDVEEGERTEPEHLRFSAMRLKSILYPGVCTSRRQGEMVVGRNLYVRSGQLSAGAESTALAYCVVYCMFT